MQKKFLIKIVILFLLLFALPCFSSLKIKEKREGVSSISEKSTNCLEFSESSIFRRMRETKIAPGIHRNPSQSNWTIIHYIDGDNNLDSYYAPSSSGSDANVDVLALDDGASDGDTHAYHIFSGANVEIPLSNIHPSWTNEVNMGDPYTLINFSRYCIDNFPSDHYLIIPQDHGSAWKGCCRDDNSLEDNLNISDLKTAFSNIAAYIGHNIDVVLFNDCLMSSMDIAVQLYPYVLYMVGGETVIWIDTWDNCDDIIDIIKATPSITPQELSIEMINLPTLHDSRSYNAQIISAINSSKIPDLQNDINDLASELINKFIKYQIEIKNARLASEDFIGPRDDVYEMLIDLYDFAENIYNKVPDTTIQNYALNVMIGAKNFGWDDISKITTKGLRGKLAQIVTYLPRKDGLKGLFEEWLEDIYGKGNFGIFEPSPYTSSICGCCGKKSMKKIDKLNSKCSNSNCAKYEQKSNRHQNASQVNAQEVNKLVLNVSLPTNR